MTDAAARRAFVLRTLIPGAVLVIASCVLGAIIVAHGNTAFDIDEWWNDLLIDWISPALLGFSWFMNAAGGGWIGVLAVPLGGALLLILVRRPWAGTYFLVASAVSAGGVQVLKHLFGRARPEEIIVISDFGSYPSGHVANAATIATVLVILFPRWSAWLVGIAWVVLMAISRTYLHAHWLSDTMGGAMIGIGAALLVAGAFAVPLLRDRSIRDRAAPESVPSLG